MTTILPERPVRIFVAMPGTTMGADAWDNIAEIKSNLLEPIAERVGIRLDRPAELVIEKDKLSIEPIHGSMFREAYEADVYIADLTGSNANVYLELGVRWALRDSVTIPISQNVAAVKFNVSATRVIPYGMAPNALRQAVEQIVEAAVHGLMNPVQVDNPVRYGHPTVAIGRTELDQLHQEIADLKAERGDDLVSLAEEAEPTAAIALLRHALTLNRNNFRAHFLLGVRLRKAGEYREAAAVLRDGLMIRPNDAEGWRELAVAQSLGSELGEAEVSINRSLALDPRNIESHANLGGIYRRQARLETDPDRKVELLRLARSSYADAHELEKNNTYPLINIALIDVWLAEDGPDRMTTLRKLELLTDLETMNNPEDPWKFLDLSTTRALLGKGELAASTALRAIELVRPGELRSHLTSAVHPLQDSLDSPSLGEDQRTAILQVLDVFETAMTRAGQ
jgi:tetratricopeptide (TPR) repeat protein